MTIFMTLVRLAKLTSACPQLAIAVGIPVAWYPPHRSGRALIRWDEKVDPRSRIALSYQ